MRAGRAAAVEAPRRPRQRSLARRRLFWTSLHLLLTCSSPPSGHVAPLVASYSREKKKGGDASWRGGLAADCGGGEGRGGGMRMDGQGQPSSGLR
jgi:hypothetical protein